MMDNKNKLAEAYLPDKSTKSGKIVVGLSGSLDSFVTAYLLKIQKYDLIGVTVLVGVEALGAEQENVFSCSLNPAKLESIKQFCHMMNIPHHLIRAQPEFQNEVVEKWAATKLSGLFSEKCWDCHSLRMNLLYQKMKSLGVKTIATGHFAKIFKNDAHGTTYVHTSNDEEHDQSALLSRLPQEVLGSLSLPLSDLQYKEVLKLAENFGLTQNNKVIRFHDCLPWNDITKAFLKGQVPERYLKDGEMMSASGAESYGPHEGVINFSYGSVVRSREREDDLHFVRYSFQDKKVLIDTNQYFKRKEVSLLHCEVTQETSWATPLRAVVQGRDGVFVECWVHPKPLHTAYLELDSAIEVFEGQMLTVFKKKGKNSKVYLTGKVKFYAQKNVSEEGTNEKDKVDYSRDF